MLGIGAIAGAAALFAYWRAKGLGGGGSSPREPARLPVDSTWPTPDASAHRGVWPNGGARTERWRGQVAARAGDLPINALLKWIDMESGGDTCSTGLSTEVGIFQLDMPSDAKYGATLAQLRAICAKSKRTNPAILMDVTAWLTPDELEQEVGAGINKVRAARDDVRKVLASTGTHWPESSFDFGTAVKQIHALPSVIFEMLPKVAAKFGPPASWAHFRAAVLAWPHDASMGHSLPYALGPSKRKLANRLADTMANAEEFGGFWGPKLIASDRDVA